MGIPSGPPPVPAMVFPHSEEGRTEFETSNRYSLSYKGVFVLTVLVVALLVAFALLLTAYWYVGVAIAILAAVLFIWPSTRARSPSK